MTTGEIVKVAKVHPNTVAVWRSVEKIKPVDKIGASFLYDRKAVMDFLAERSRKREENRKKKEEASKASSKK